MQDLCPLCLRYTVSLGAEAAPNRGAACRVRDEHAVTEQLGYQLRVRSFAAARASAGEFHERLS